MLPLHLEVLQLHPGFNSVDIIRWYRMCFGPRGDFLPSAVATVYASWSSFVFRFPSLLQQEY